MQNIVKFNGKKIIAIDIMAKQWWDKQNGNTYQAIQVSVLLEQDENQPYNYWKTVAVQPFEYGSDNWHVGQKLLAKRLGIDEKDCYKLRELVGGAPITSNVRECKKAEVKAFGLVELDA